MMPIKRAPRKHHFTIVRNESIEDSRLSFKARGLLVYMLSKSDDWQFYERELVTHTAEGRAAVRSGLQELVQCGYLSREQDRETGGNFGGSVWTVYEAPQLPLSENQSTVETPTIQQSTPKKEELEQPKSEKPTAEKWTSENQTLPSTDLTKDLLNQDTTTTTSADPLKPVQQFWESNGFGSMTQYLWQDFEKWLADFKRLGATQENAVALIIKALQSCVEAGPDKRNQRYMRGILNRYANSRYTSVADVEADEKARKASQQPTGKRNGNAAQHDVYHDHRLDDDFQAAIDRMAANGKETATDPLNDPLPY